MTHPVSDLTFSGTSTAIPVTSFVGTPSVSGTTSSTSTASPEFASFQRFLSSELQSFKEDLKRQNDESINDAVKRMRFEQSSRHQFKSKGNEEQFRHSEKVAAHVDTAIRGLEAGKIFQVREALEEGKNLISTRMKHIVLADMHGWDFVTEYKLDPIADDDSDEKRIRKVLKSVESQREKKKAEKAKKTNKFKLENSRRNVAMRNEFSSNYPMNANCYICGKPGHFWRSCIYRSRVSPTTGVLPTLSTRPMQLQPAVLPSLPTIVPPALPSK